MIKDEVKLRNKKTGEIRDAVDVIIENLKKNGSTLNAINIDEIKEKWEDYEEPKEYWYIGIDGEIYKKEHDYFNEAQDNIGNRFETKEEAEKAVEKLKAFANLRKRGLKFNGWDEADRGMVGEFAIYCDALELDGIERELEIVFGREEL